MIFQIEVDRRSKIEKRVQKNLALPKIEIWITEIQLGTIPITTLRARVAYIGFTLD